MTPDSPDLIDKIYEAAVIPDRWPDIIGGLSDRFGCKGGLLFTATADDFRYLAAGESIDLMRDFLAEGWGAHNDRVPRLVATRYAGFVTDTDVYTPAEIAAHPMYQEFLFPRGLTAAAATLVQGASDDLLILSVEGFGDDGAARAAIPYLDTLRPHLARAAMLASQFHLERARAATAALQMIGAPAAFVTARGQIRCANDLFGALIGSQIFDGRGGIRFDDAHANACFRRACESRQAAAFSIPLKATAQRPAAILHVLPVTGSARDVFLAGGFIFVLKRAGLCNKPNGDMLQALFDLTPAEARLARALVDGSALGEIAARFGVQVATVRSQLKSLFLKLNVSRQAQLVALIGSLTLN